MRRQLTSASSAVPRDSRSTQAHDPMVDEASGLEGHGMSSSKPAAGRVARPQPSSDREVRQRKQHGTRQLDRSS